MLVGIVGKVHLKTALCGHSMQQEEGGAFQEIYVAISEEGKHFRSRATP